jgi:hypothetical protein
MGLIDLAQDGEQQRALHSMIMNNILGNRRVAEQLAASEEGLSSMVLVSY